MNITYNHQITVEHYNSLRQSVGWEVIEAGLAQTGLDNTAFLIVANDEDTPIGMTRVITDYGHQVLLADVIINPGYQRKGIGRELMKQAMAYIDESIAPGQMKMINLMAAKGRESFYEQFGFITRPNEIRGAGMSQEIRKEVHNGL